MPAILFIIFSLIWYLPMYLRQGKEGRLPFKYCLMAILLGAVPVFLVSVLFQALFANVRNWLGLTGLAKEAFDAFAGAALTEELFKFLAALLVVKKAKPTRKIDYVLLFGGVGLGFGLTESVIGVTNIVSAVLGAVMAFHLFWQYFMGLEYYEYGKRAPGGKIHLVLSLAVPFVMHGVNDFLVFSLSKMLKQSQLDDLGAVMVLAAVGWYVLFLIFIIYVLVRVNRAVKETKV